MGWCPNFASLWPLPQLGEAVARDPRQPELYPESPSRSQSIHRAARGPEFEGEYTAQRYVVGMDHLVIPSLARQMRYTWGDAAFNVGGPHYPLDYGFGPGYHGDCMSPQFYMRPGIRMPLQQGGRQM